MALPERQLREAAELGDVRKVDAVLRRHGTGIINATCGTTGWSALHASADRGRLGALRHLLGMRADPGMRTARGATALSLASNAGHTDCVKALLDIGADPAQTAGHNARTALHGAMRSDRTESVRALVAAGADADRPSVMGVTARDLCGVAPPERFTWQAHTAAQILRDPFYLSATETAEQYPPLEDMLHSAIYAADAKRWAAESRRPIVAPLVVAESGAASTNPSLELFPETAPSAAEEAAARGDATAAARAADLASDAETARLRELQEQEQAAAAQKLAQEHADANAARLQAAIEQQRQVEQREAERLRTAEEQKRQARFDKMKAESEAREAQLLGAFEPDVQTNTTQMERLHEAAEQAAAERESAAVAAAEARAAALQQEQVQQQLQPPGQAPQQPEQASTQTSTPREPPPPEAPAAANLTQWLDPITSPSFVRAPAAVDAPPVLFPSTQERAGMQLLPSGPTVSIVLVKGDRVTLAKGAPPIFNLKPGR